MEIMTSLPTINPESYDFQVSHNNSLTSELFNQMFPGFLSFINPDCLFEIISFLSETHVNPRVLPKVIRGINNIMMGTGSGQVIVHVTKDFMNVSVRETDEEMKCKSG